ncbi:MAG: metal ABC transporter permease [Bacillota bacterium]|nr:metal ABC transporter permease [Bacillota bacterium]
MLELFQYDFLQRAFIVSAVLALVMPLIGIVIVNKNISVIGDALSHTALAGVIFGLIIGVNPMVSTLVIVVFASILIEFLRKNFPGYSSISTTIVMSFSIGLASVLTDFVQGASNLESYLFGSLVAIGPEDLKIVLGLGLMVFLFSIYFYKDLQHISFDETSARVGGTRVDLVNFIFTILTAITIAVASRTIGVMIVSSMLVIPVACSIQLRMSYLKTIISSSIFGFAFMVLGLLSSFYFDLKPGGTTVIIATISLIIIILLKEKK